MAATTKESGAWVHALPMSSLGLRMDDNVVHVTPGIRLGVTLCRVAVDHLGSWFELWEELRSFFKTCCNK